MSNDDLYVQQFGRIKRQPTIDLDQLKQAASKVIADIGYGPMPAFTRKAALRQQRSFEL
jgi:hypothetical protein